MFTAEHVSACARGLAEGRSLVRVRTGLGQSQKAMDILEEFGPVDTDQVMPESETGKLEWDEAAPLSSALGIPTISRNAPAPVSNFLGLPLLSRNPAPLSSMLALKTLSSCRPGERELEGMSAVCLQHEIDHLNGTLFVDRLSLFRRLRLRAAEARARWNRASTGATVSG